MRGLWNVEKEMLGQEKIGKLLVKLSVPAMIGMLTYSLYNLVDTIFIGRGIGALAIGGITLVFPIQILLMALGMMLGIGAASVISRNLGSGDLPRACRAAGSSLSLAVVAGLVIMLPGLLFITPLLQLFGATGALLPYGQEYLSMILLGSVFTTVSLAGNNILRAEGKAGAAMVVMLIGTGVNIPLDYLFIFIIPMGIRGAALATVISQGMSFCFILGFFLSHKSALPLKAHHFCPNPAVTREILALGVPIFVRQGSKSILMIIVNNRLKKYGGKLAIPAFGAIFRLLAFMLLPVLGVGQGFQPIAGYNYGGGKNRRVLEVIKKACFSTTLLATLAFGLMMVFPGYMLGMFSDDPSLLAEAVPALKIMILALPATGFQVIGSLYFFAIGKAMPALILGLSRQALLLIPLVLFLPLVLDLKGVWLAFPLADILSTVMTLVWMIKILQIKKIPVPLQQS